MVDRTPHAEPQGGALRRFEGPLDLLHELITQRALDITTISLAAVAEQYVEEVSRMVEADLDRLTSFLVMASRLLLIKSQALLPRSAEAEEVVEDDAGDLLRQLQEYQIFKALATQLRTIQEKGHRTYPRQVPFPVTPRPRAGSGSVDALMGALRRALTLAPESPPTESVAPLQFPVAVKVAELDRILRLGSASSFSALLARASCRQEAIAYFLALLEVLRRGKAMATQAGLFGEILLAPVPREEDAGQCQAEEGA
ncbi:MAG: segregation/condensation protein A [Dehalococcoidales bacterium]|nr:segregation/condensation protein A [Dehalococcoidales bacterium]